MLMKQPARIQLLSQDLASKIAAGEVVERPASVLKELLENSIDSGATQIDIFVDKGGIESIKIRDNGSGILCEDLQLALTQHATSKIVTSQDLESIASLGFRGEALASINSVAKLSIISNTADQDHAWCIDSNNQLSAAAHPIGTTVHMQDLFYNVPARRKFLRSERTEYQHLEEVFRRIALSNFDIAFSLTNQNKLVKSLPICKNQASQTRRLINLCGQQILNKAATIDAEQNGLKLWGWVGAAQQARSQEPHQYFFINKRVIRDRLINHAIRQVYQPLCAEGKMLFYCLHLELDPVSLDVNVHPTKHEVRFRDARVIHAFLTQVIGEALGASIIPPDQTSFNKFNSAYNNLKNNSELVPHIKILSILENKIILAQRQNKIILLDIIALRARFLLRQLLSDNINIIDIQPPQIINISSALNFDNKFAMWCKNLGFVLEAIGPQQLVMRNMPQCLHAVKINCEILLQKLYVLYSASATIVEAYTTVVDLVKQQPEITEAKALELLNSLDSTSSAGLWRELSVEQLYDFI